MAASQLRENGFERLAYALPPPVLDDLRGEAARLRPTAAVVETKAYEVHADGQEFRSPVRYHVSERGGRLHALHEGDELCGLAADLAGTEMTPTKAGYLFYERDDRIGLHTDLPACELVLLAALDPVAPPLVVHPELRSLTPEELAELAIAVDGAPAGGVSVPLDDSAVVGLFGGGLPHQTRPVGAGSEAVVLTLCYAGARS